MMIQRALIIEDNEDDAALLAILLHQANPGIQQIHAQHGGQALSLLKNRYAPQAVFLDMNMPLLSGPEFLSAFRKEAEFRHIPAIIVSACTAPNRIAEAFARGCDAYLVKPIDYQKYLHLIRMIVTDFEGLKKLNPVMNDLFFN